MNANPEVEERDGQQIVRDQTQNTESPRTVEPVGGEDPGQSASHPDRRRGPDEYARELGLADSDLTGTEFDGVLYRASGGWTCLARTVLEIAARTELPEDVTSTSFADYVVGLAPRPDLELTVCDERAAAVLSHMTSFSKQVALLSLSSVSSAGLCDSSLRDSEGILMRLRMAGVLVTGDDGFGRKHLFIPPLVAAALRRSAADWENHRAVIEDLVGALTDHLENSQAVSPQILADVVDLARRNGLWSVLVRLQEIFGLSMFLLAPRAVCEAYAGLPAQALDREPELVVMFQLADALATRQSGGITYEGTRTALSEDSQSGRMLRLFSDDRALGITPIANGPESSAGSFSMVRRILDLARAGDHAMAAEAGLHWSGEARSRRAELVIRLLTAISMFHSSEPRRALSVLHEIEILADERHLDGDFLLPAIAAWTALVAAVSGDHERADRHLDWLRDEVSLPIIMGAFLQPATRIASALRALDRLDLEGARQEYDLLVGYPEPGSLWVYIPAIRRSFAILSATTPPELLLSNDVDESSHHTTFSSSTGRDLLIASRSMIHIGLGQLKWAEAELEQMSAHSDVRIVLSVQVELIAGRYENAIVMVDKWFYHQSLTPRSRASLAAFKAAALLRVGPAADAVTEFLMAVELSALVNSLLPIAFIPHSDRLRLLELTEDAEEWNGVLAVFPGHFRSKDDLLSRLRTVGSISVDRVSMPQLNAGEAKLLEMLAQGLSITQMSKEFQQVPGTVKNRLSVLYHKFGVASKTEVIIRAQLLGFLRS